MEFLIVTGLSGAGKSRVAVLLEDMGFYCVDNLPLALLPQFAELCLASEGRYSRVALVTDVRAGQTFEDLFVAIDLLRGMNCPVRILFMEANAETIVRRYKETRRRHPLAVEGETLEQTIEREWKLLEVVRGRADTIINTTAISGENLKNQLVNLFAEGQSDPAMMVMVNSFGFKYGLPMESDLVFDVRFLPNPFHVYDLRPLTGLDARVSSYVMNSPDTAQFVRHVQDLLTFLLPQYVREGKAALVLSIGCTGGRHRSVALAEHFQGFVSELGYHTAIHHRDMARG